MGYFTGNGKDALALKDPYFNQVELLLKTKGSNGTDNGTFKDTSSAEHTITKSGSPIQGTFSPFSSNGWSGFFDGTVNYLEANPYYFDFPTDGFNSTSLTGFSHGPGSQSSSQVAGPLNGYYRFTDAQSTSGGYIVDNTARQYDKDFSIQFKMSPQGNYFPDGFTCALNSNSSTIGTRGVMTPPANGGRQVFFNVVNWFGPQPPYQTLKFYEETTGTLNTLATADSGFTGGYAGPSTAGFFGGTQYWWWDYEHSTGTHKIYHSTSSTKPSTPRVTATFTMPSTPMHAYIGGGTGGANTEWRLLEWSASVTPVTDLQLVNTDFTVEAWIYLTEYPNNDNGYYISHILSKDANAGNSTREWRWYLSGTATSYTTLDFFYFRNSSPYHNTYSSSFNFQLNTWYHIRTTKSGTNLYHFVDGSLIGTHTNVVQDSVASTSDLRIGHYWNTSSTVATFKGYISNLRLVKGTALSTTSFNVPTEPLTAVTNTKLLTLQDNLFIDNSSSNHSVTANGDVAIKPKSPFRPSVTRNNTSVLNRDGSTYFDGSNDSLVVSPGSDFDFGTGDFTVETWYYCNALNSSTYSVIIDARDTAPYNVGTFWIIHDNNNRLSFTIWSPGGTAATLLSINSIQVGRWYHVAFCRSNGTLRAFLDGVLQAETSNNFDINSGHPYVHIGSRLHWSGAPNGSNFLNGYLSNFRVVKGTALYTATFTPPTGPLRNVPNTKLLLNSINAPIYDATGKNNLLTLDTTQINTTIRKFSRPSIKFDGTSDGIDVPSDKRFDLGQPWTVECWFYVNSGSTQDCVFALQSTGGTNSPWYFVFGISQNDSYAKVMWNSSAANGSYEYPNIITANVWQHVACSYNGSNVRTYVNGTLWHTLGISISNWQGSTSSSLSIGYDLTSNMGSFNGYMSDFRFTAGVARYSGSSFNVPTEEFVSA